MRPRAGLCSTFGDEGRARKGDKLIPILLGAHYNCVRPHNVRVPQMCQSTTTARTTEEEEARDGQMLTLSFHDRFAALGAGAPGVVRRSTRVLTPSVRLRPLPESITRTVQTTSGSTGPPTTRATARRAPPGRASGRARTAYTASLKPFYTRPSDLRHPMEDEFAQLAWGADLGLGGLSTTCLLYTSPSPRDKRQSRMPSSA